MSARLNKKRKGRNHASNRERTVTTFTEDPNTSFLVPLPSEDPPTILSSPFSSSSFSMSYQNYISPQQPQFYQPIPGKTDLEILENLKSIIKEGQHPLFRAVPQPAALASLYMGHIPQGQHPDQVPQEYPTPCFSHDTSVDNTNGPDTAVQLASNMGEPHTPLSGADVSPVKLGADPPSVPEANNPLPAQPDSEDGPRITRQGPPADINTDNGEYGVRQPADIPLPNKAAVDATDDEPPQPTGDRRSIDSKKGHYDDHKANMSPTRATTHDNKAPNGATTTTDARFPLPEDNRILDRDRDRDRDRFSDRDRDRDWERDRDRHDPTRDTRDRGRDRDIGDRRAGFFGRSYGRSHAPRPPPELRHYEPSYGADYVPPPRRFDADDRRGGPRSAPFDDHFKPPPFDDRRPPFDDRRPPPADDRRLTLDDRPMKPLPGSDTRPFPPSSEDRARPAGEAVPLARATAEDDRGPRAPSLAADDRPRATITLEERLSQPAPPPPPSLQDRLSQPKPNAIPSRVEITPAPTLEERLSLGPVPPRTYPRAASVARDEPRAPLAKDELRDQGRIADFRPNRDFSRERTGAPLIASSYRPDQDRGFGDRDERDRRDRVVADVDPPLARFGDVFSRAGPPPPRRFSPPPPAFDRERERERARSYYPTRSPPPFRGEGAYNPDADRRYTADRERDPYEQRRREWYPGEDDKRAAPAPSAPWRPHERPPFMDRDRERLDRERERERDVRERDRERDRDLTLAPPPPPPTRGQWDDRERRFPPGPPSRMDSTGDGPRSLSARLTDPYPPPPSGADERYPPPREFERGRYGPPGMDEHAHGHPPLSRVRNRSPTPPRRGLLAEELRPPPLKRVREDGAGYGSGGPAYSPPRRGEYAPGPPPLSTATTGSVGTSVGNVPPRTSDARTPPVSAPPPPPPSTGTSGFYERVGDRERDREREREYVRGEYGGYDRDGRGRRSPPLLGTRMGSGVYGRVVGRDERRYVPPPRTN